MSFLFQCEFSCFRFNTQSLSQVEEPSRPQGRWLLVNAKNGTVAMVIDMDTAITENQTWMTFTLFSVENTI